MECGIGRIGGTLVATNYSMYSNLYWVSERESREMCAEPYLKYQLWTYLLKSTFFRKTKHRSCLFLLRFVDKLFRGGSFVSVVFARYSNAFTECSRPGICSHSDAFILNVRLLIMMLRIHRLHIRANSWNWPGHGQLVFATNFKCLYSIKISYAKTAN